MEWDDFLTFATLAVVFAPLFFPSSDPNTALLASLATFGVGMVVRPLGVCYFWLNGRSHWLKAGIYKHHRINGVCASLRSFLAYLCTSRDLGTHHACELALTSRILRIGPARHSVFYPTNRLIKKLPISRRISILGVAGTFLDFSCASDDCF